MVKARYDLGNKTLHCLYSFFCLSLVDPTHHINTVRTDNASCVTESGRSLYQNMETCMHACTLSPSLIHMFSCENVLSRSVTKTITHYYLPALRFNILRDNMPARCRGLIKQIHLIVL